MPETEYECITKEWLQTELRSSNGTTTTTATLTPAAGTTSTTHSSSSTATNSTNSSSATSSSSASSSSSSTSSTSSSTSAVNHAKDLIILDCRSSNEYSECHIRSAVNFSIPSIMLRRLAAGKIDLLSTIKSPELKERIQNGYKLCLFILYNDVGVQPTTTTSTTTTASTTTTGATTSAVSMEGMIIEQAGAGNSKSSTGTGSSIIAAQQHNNNNTADTVINVLHRRLKQDGCRVVSLQDGFTSFRQSFPEWCEDDGMQNKEMESSRSTQADQLMGLRSLRISTPHSDSACSSSGESSDCESTTHHHHHHHHHQQQQQLHHHHHHHHHHYHNNEAPVEIIQGLFLGNESHSCDSMALQKYNIKYVLNVTPDLPNVFEESGDIQYLQIPITDHYSQDLAMHFPAAIQFIEEARSKNNAVLVHCLAGVSRSVTVTLAYLMHNLGLCLNEAFTLVRDRKPDVSPNFHFMQQLHSFERQLRLSPNDGDYTAMDEGGTVPHGLLTGGNNAMQVPSTGMIGRCGGNVTVGGAGGVGMGMTGVINVVGSGSNVGGGSGGNGSSAGGVGVGMRSSKFSCNCIANDCKCMQTAGSYMTQLSKATGVSPDSGIEFDRWTPSADTGLK